MTTQSALLLLTAATPLHAGTGQSAAGVDLPIQREAHNRWPCVFGSAVKGALRAHAFHHPDFKPDDLIELFGPDHAAAAGERDSSHAGALLVGDALLLALPVRSLQSAFKWVTCPAALRRFAQHAERLGLNLNIPQGFAPDAQTALGGKAGPLFLEEFRFAQQQNTDIAPLAQTLAQLSGGGLDAPTLEAQLVVVSNDIFAFLVQNATPVNAHIAIDAASKTVKDGALWHEESLPPETLLYIPLTATASRKKGSERSAAQLLERFEQLLPAGKNWLQLGGNETTGMGWCRVGIHKAQA
ncbi:type III-B CRISPR module RAMP protein Cmr4 [Vandammella animalimorsus]|uniref:Type III-B CRISPR module RAMP protein Cmr4 n=1 Tax=Vandammella animalimorsus TaxID=2029117 RepID=A0A2A2AFF9_9BURK|nr:type III-B CRISPR module RAMP protein Cmr4 [Vandammella animalimorsus]PAT36462.1 type III-B CRISPR module RAMP protein Cmr4 [Vandammella animalimorsus]